MREFLGQLGREGIKNDQSRHEDHHGQKPDAKAKPRRVFVFGGQFGFTRGQCLAFRN